MEKIVKRRGVVRKRFQKNTVTGLYLENPFLHLVFFSGMISSFFYTKESETI